MKTESNSRRASPLVCVDVGGTKKHAVVIGMDGTIFAEQRIPHKSQSPKAHIDIVENDANLATLGEWHDGAGGIILNGRLYRGNGGASGEIGHMATGVESLRENRLYDFGGFESTVSARGIVLRTNAYFESIRIKRRVEEAKEVFDASSLE